MSNEMNLPWRVELSDTKPGVVGNDGYLIAEAFSSNVSAHIVKCVNAHDALVEALQGILDMCNEDSHARDYASRQTEIRGTAIVALRKAQGEGK